nr:inactive protein kinase SELMODRAFT_444075 [Tanacetum cinerariifolium]
MTKLPKCSCAAREDVSKHNQLIKLMQFLMGLNDVFQPIRSSLLARETLLDVKEAFAIISREESHIGITSSSSKSVTKPQVSSFVAKFNSWTNIGNKKFDNNRRIGNSSNNRGPNPKLHCTNCEKNPGPKPNGPRTFNANFVSSSSEKGASLSFTNEQMMKLMNLINEAPSGSVHANMVAASILVLPEGCISDILSLTSPRDASRAAAISKTFKTAADSDFEASEDDDGVLDKLILDSRLGFNFFSPTMGTIDSVKSIVTQSALDALWEKFYIPDVFHPELPGHNDRIHNIPTDILGYFRINLSQLSVIAAAKVSHFEILCRVNGFVPSVDSFIFPLAVLWHCNKTLKNDPPPTPGEFDADVCDYLVNYPAPFRKFLEPFLCFVGIKMDLFAFIHHANPTKVKIGERESAGNDNVNEKGNDAAVTDDVVDVGGIDIMADSEIQAIVADQLKRVRKKRKASDGASGSGFPPKKLREDHGASGNVGAAIARKSLAALKGLLDRSILAAERATKMFVVLSDSSHHSSTNVADDEVTSIVRSSMPPLPVLTASVATTTTTSATSTPVYELDMDSKTLRQIYIPMWNVINDPTLDDMDIFQSMIDQLAPFVFFFLLRSVNYEQFFEKFNVGATRQVCFSAKVRMRLEHELRTRYKFEGRCAMQANWLKERDAEISNLKARLSLKKAKAAKAVRLRGQIAIVKATEVARVSELDGLKERNAALEGQVAALESALSCNELSIKASTLDFEKEKLVDQVSQLEVLSDKVAELDADLMRMALHLDEEFYPWYLTTIASQRRRLVEVTAYSLSAEENYVVGVNALCVVDFPLLAHLASHQDSSISDLMDLLCLEGPAAETSKVVIGEFLIFSLDLAHACVWKLKENDASQQLSISDALIPIVEPMSVENLIGEASTFGVPVTATTIALSTTFVQDSTILLVLAVDHEASGVGLSTEVPSPSKIVFEKEELDTMLKHTTALSRLISKASSFCTMSIFAVRKVGMPISAGMIASIPYVSENGVSPLLDLIMVRLWNFSKFNNDYTTGKWKSLSGDVRDQKEDITESCSQMMLQLHNLYDSDKIKMKIKVISGNTCGAVAAESKKTRTQWVVLDKNLKQEAKICMDELECNVVVMKKARPKVLRLNLIGSPTKEQENSTSCLDTQTDCFGENVWDTTKVPNVTPVSSPEHSSFTTTTEHKSSSLSSSDLGFSPFLVADHDWDNTKKDVFLDTDSDSDSDNISSSLSTSLCSPWRADVLTSSDEFPKMSLEKGSKHVNEKVSMNPITDALRVKFTELDHRLEKSPKNVKEMISLARHVPPKSPPLCTICQHKAPVFGTPPKWFSFIELEEATDSFSRDNFLAEGGFGSVHRGVLKDGRMVAVKQHKIASSQGDNEFFSEVEVLSCAQHRNVVMLIGFCVEDGRRMLVYEYICNRSLDTHLYGCIVHRDMRPNNILLTHDFEALVGDFRLARWQPDGETGVETRIIGTFGYLAPEYAQTGEITEKADVYSFGVVLVELITGRKAVDINRPKGQQYLTEWARPLLEETAIAELIDPRLKDSYSEAESESAAVFKVLEIAAAREASRGEVSDNMFDMQPSGRTEMLAAVSLHSSIFNKIWKLGLTPSDQYPFTFKP